MILRLILYTFLALLIKNLFFMYTDLQTTDPLPKLISVRKYHTFLYPAPIRIIKENGAMCSGFVISDIYALSAAHCAVDSTRLLSKLPVNIYSFDDKFTNIQAVFVALDHNQDIALLKGDFSSFHSFKINTHYSPAPHDLMVGCGFPANTTYVCAATSFDLNFGSQYFVHGAPIYHGMSGGPVFNSNKEVIGVNSAIATNGSVFGPLAGMENLWGI